MDLEPTLTGKLSLPRRALRRQQGAVAVFELCDERNFTATSLVGNGAFDEYVLTGEEFETLGPSIQDLIVHAEGLNFTSNFSYDVVLQTKFRLGSWVTVTPSVLGLQTSAAYAISSAFSDRTKMGVRIRLVLRAQVTAGSTATQHGSLNIAVATRFYAA